MSKRLTISQLQKLSKNGKIVGFFGKKLPENGKNVSKIVTTVHKNGSCSPEKNWISLTLQAWCKERSLKLIKEYRFHPVRKWRFDYCLVDEKIGIEYEGGIFVEAGNKGHRSITGIKRDIEKYNEAQLLGYRIIRLAPHNYRILFHYLNIYIDGK